MSAPLSHEDRKVLLNALRDASVFRNERSRSSFVNNAVGGYAFSRQIEDALGFVNWEGSPFDVGFDLISKLNGQDLAPGVPVLAKIAEALEPIAGAHSEALAKLRQRMTTGGVLDSPQAPKAVWRDSRPADEVVEERIIGENTLRPLYYLRRALMAADAVVRIDMAGMPNGTGFMVAPDLLVTNHHVIHNEQEAQFAQACFFNEAADDDARPEDRGSSGETYAKPVAANALLYTSRELDVSIVRLESAPKLKRCLALSTKAVEQNDRVVIIQHPGGLPKQISLQNNLVAHADPLVVQYYTSTKAGSSGSPVLDERFRVVAVHHGWVHSESWTGNGQIRDAKAIEDMQYRNEGTSVIALVADLKLKAPALLGELTVRED